MTTELEFMTTLSHRIANGTLVAVSWLDKNWKFCHYCGALMIWYARNYSRMDRTTGKPTNLWNYMCEYRARSPLDVHDSVEDFEVISLEEPQPLRSLPDPTQLATLSSPRPLPGRSYSLQSYFDDSLKDS